MPNGIPLTIGGQPSILGAFASGQQFRQQRQQFRQQQQQTEAETARQARLLELRTQLGQAAVDQQPVAQVPQLGTPAQQPTIQDQQLAIQAQQLGQVPVQQPQQPAPLGIPAPVVPVEPSGPSRAQLQRQFEAEFPAEARQFVKDQKAKFDNQTEREKQRDISLVRSASKIQGLPVDQQLRILRQDRQSFVARGLPVNDTDEQIALLETGRVDEANALTDQTVQFGEAIDILKPAAPARAKVIAETDKIRAETDKIRAETGRPRVSDKERAETEKIRAEADKIRANIARGDVVSPQDSKILTEERKETVKANVRRISDLSQSSKSRKAAADKASEFLRLIQGGAETGTTRRLLGFIPGVFTTQAAFDQKLDSFSEVAAREKLKAVGEIRPTDADVAGMKRALFGVGRDEETNIQLLTEFIAEQQGLDDELKDLRKAKKRGELAEFTGEELPPEDIDLTTLTLDQLIELRQRAGR